MIKRRVLVYGPIAATLAATAVITYAQQVRRIRVFGAAGGASDIVARGCAEVLARIPTIPTQVIVESTFINNISRSQPLTYKPGKDLYVLTGDVIKRLQLTTGVQFVGFFTPLLSLGRSRSALVSSKSSKIDSIKDLRRLRGYIRLPEPRQMLGLGGTKHLAAPMVIAQAAPQLGIRPESIRENPSLALFQDEIDLAIADIDAMNPMRRTASLLMAGAHPREAAAGVGPLERFTANLPVEDEYFLAADISWNLDEAREVARQISANITDIQRAVARSRPAFLKSSLSAPESQSYLDSYSFGKRIVTVRLDVYQGCGQSSACQRTQLTAAQFDRVAKTNLPNGALANCQDPGGPGVRPGLTPDAKGFSDFPPCLDPRIVQSADSSAQATAPDKSWWEKIKDFLKIDTSLGRDAGKGLKGIGDYAKMIDAVNNEDWDKLDELSTKANTPPPKAEGK